MKDLDTVSISKKTLIELLEKEYKCVIKHLNVYSDYKEPWICMHYKKQNENKKHN